MSSANGDLLQKYLTRPGVEGPSQTAEEQAEPIDDFAAFGWLRGARDRAVMLELRKKTGNITAIGYAWIEKMEFDPSSGIRLFVPGQVFTIEGRYLNTEIRPNVRLFEGLARHRVPWIQESSEIALFGAGGNNPIVDEITW